ncbi:MAG: cysteine--tRNA ligase [Candidatus Omnitrophota bacterium]
MNIYNTLTRKKEEFEPLKKGKVNMYVCGPTVYDVPHIGHARSAYVFEIIRRYFSYSGMDVCFVRNVTDIDDKIIKKALTELEENGKDAFSGALKDKVKDVAARYLDVYHSQLEKLGITPPTIEPKATDNIPQMIVFIEKLIHKGYAYERAGDVYFSIEKFKDYGKLSKRAIEDMMHGVRIGLDDKKKHPLDFALWKSAKPYEPSWESPWGKGRPGWHIECSVMSTNIFGEQFDIHGGGLDLIFPHHENEIAQAEAVTGKTFARYWIHNGLLTARGEKMSKSLGNYITILDFLAKYNDPDLLKIIFWSSHYRSPMDYSDEKVKDAKRSKERIMIFLDKADRFLKTFSKEEIETGNSAVIARMFEDPEIKKYKSGFEQAMNDDFNTPQAMSVMFECVKLGNDWLADEVMDADQKIHKIKNVKDMVLLMAEIMGLSLKAAEMDDALISKIEELISLREQARKQKDYASADKLRKELTIMGIVVEDTSEGQIWRKK